MCFRKSNPQLLIEIEIEIQINGNMLLPHHFYDRIINVLWNEICDVVNSLSSI